MAHALYTKVRNKVNSILRKGKKDFERETARESKTNPKMLWYHVRKLKTKCGVAPLLADIKDKNTLKYDDKEKAEVLQNQFSSVFTRETDGTLPNLSSRTESFITNMHMSETIVKKELKSVNVNKSLGPDEIQPRLMAELANFLSEPVTLLFNKSILHGVLPKEWKEAYIFPIYKKGSKSYSEKYRQISFTCFLSKLLESFVKEKV